MTLYMAGPLDDLLDEISGEPELAEPDPARRKVELRLAEAELVEQVIFEQHPGLRVDGHAYRRLFDDLWLYAWPVIKAFIRLNRIGQVLRRYDARLSCAIAPEDQVVLRSSEAERDALAVDVIAAAVDAFHRRALLERKWSPTGGASLRTWFIGTCALNFPRAYRRWSSNRVDRLARVALSHDLDLDMVGTRVAAWVPDPATVVVDRDDLRAIVDLAQPTTRLILGMIMEGWSHAEIAAELELTVKAVEGRIYRLRQRVRERQLRDTKHAA